MGLFSKNPNEAAYVGGKKHWTDVIKNDAPGELMLWRAPEEDFNTKSTLIVNPGEKAIFINNGVVEQTFENGRYQLSTENYPFISRLRNAFSGGISTFHCIVYFFRAADSQELTWGTPSPITVRDKVWGVVTNARAYGAYKLRVSNPAVMLEKLIGNNVILQTQEELYKYFDNELQSKIKTRLSKFLNSLETELIGLDAYLEELGDQACPAINEVVSEYGLECVKFVISGLTIDMTKYDAIDAAQVTMIQEGKLSQAEAARKIMNAQADVTVMETLGENWNRQKAVDLLGTLAANPGAGGTAAMGAGMGMGMAAGNAFAGIASQAFAPMTPTAPPSVPGVPAGAPAGAPGTGRFGVAGSTPAPAAPAADSWTCGKCGQQTTGRFCNNCGSERPAPAAPAAESWTCTCCGAQATGRFCNNCGKPKPAADGPWVCTCGTSNPGGRFCGGCGKPKGDA